MDHACGTLIDHIWIGY